MKEYNVTTEAEFQQVMESIDKELRAENSKITARPIAGWIKYASRFGLELGVPPPGTEPREGCYTGMDITARIFKWFDERYGDRLLIDFAVGNMAILIHGDLYKFKFPTVLGQIGLTCSPKYFGKEPPIVAGGAGEPIPTIDVLNCIEEFTAVLANSLTQEELNHLAYLWKGGYNAFMLIDEVSRTELVLEAKGDIAASVTHLFSDPPQYGLSKWASLQATEKLIKAFIKKKGSTSKRSHDLADLAGSAETLGLPQMPRPLLDSIQCEAGVRYGDPAVTMQEAVAAHQASLNCASRLAAAISQVK